MTEQERKNLLQLINNNIERVEWTLKDPEWRPSREYLEKLLAAYKAHTTILLTNA